MYQTGNSLFQIMTQRTRKRNFMQRHHKWFSAHWERKRWLALFTHNLLRRVIRSQRTPTLKASKTQPWEISLPHLMPTRITTSHNKSDAESYKLQSSVLTLSSTTNRSHIWLFHGKETLWCFFHTQQICHRLNNETIKATPCCCLRLQATTKLNPCSILKFYF